MGVDFAKGCAWRAVYVSVGGRQVFHLGIDPTFGARPRVFGGVWGRSGGFLVPTLQGRRGGALGRWLYRLQQRALWALDGRGR